MDEDDLWRRREVGQSGVRQAFGPAPPLAPPLQGFPSLRVFRKGHDDIYIGGMHEHEAYMGQYVCVCGGGGRRAGRGSGMPCAPAAQPLMQPIPTLAVHGEGVGNAAASHHRP